MDANYERWHPDHIEFSWVEGETLVEGAKAFFEERIAGKTQAKTVRFTAVVPSRYIEFKPTSLLVGLLMPSISFTIGPTETAVSSPNESGYVPDRSALDSTGASSMPLGHTHARGG